MGPLTTGFYGKNYIFPCREFKIQDSHLKLGIYVQLMGLDRYSEPKKIGGHHAK